MLSPRPTTRRTARIALAAAALLALFAGCDLLPAARPAIECVDLPQVECERQVERLVNEAQRMQPPKRIVSIRLTAQDGGDVRYDDGTGMSWIP